MLTCPPALMLFLLLRVVTASPTLQQALLDTHTPWRYSAMVVFGDSFSDNGNGTYKFSNGIWPPSTAWRGRFSDGPVWNEYVAGNLSIPLYNYAVGGSTTSNAIVQGYSGFNSTIPVPSVDERLAEFLEKSPTGLDFSTALFVVSGGANDIFFNEDANPNTTVSTLAECTALLQKRGARDFLFLDYYEVSMVSNDTHVSPDTRQKRANWGKGFEKALGELHKTCPGSYLYRIKPDIPLRLNDYGEPKRDGGEPFRACGTCVRPEQQGVSESKTCNDPYIHVLWDEFHPASQTHSSIAAGILKCYSSEKVKLDFSSDTSLVEE